MHKVSAGLLMYKIKDGKISVFIVHPGGPFWKDKDKGAWGIPKGEIDKGEENDFLQTAIREMKEETGINPPSDRSRYISLGSIQQKSGKVVHAWGFEGDWSGLLMCKSYITIEYPYKSGKFLKIPEVDKAGFFSIESAKEKINAAQIELMDRLEKHLRK